MEMENEWKPNRDWKYRESLKLQSVEKDMLDSDWMSETSKLEEKVSEEALEFENFIHDHPECIASGKKVLNGESNRHFSENTVCEPDDESY